MRNSPLILAGAILALGVGELATMPVAQAGFDFMNPSKWFGGNNNNRRYDDDYYYDRYRYGGYGPGWGGYGPGYGGYGPYGGYPGYGYGAPYGYPAQQQQEKAPERVPQ